MDLPSKAQHRLDNAWGMHEIESSFHDVLCLHIA
jgi:hypothetical protein